MKRIWTDVETTSIKDNECRIIELACVYEENSTGFIFDPKKHVFHKYCLPFNKRPESFDEIEELTGLTWKFLVENGIPELEFYYSFKKWLNQFIDPYDKNDKAVMAGYNPKFDSGKVRELFERNHDNYYGSYFISINQDVMSDIAKDFFNKNIPTLKNFKQKDAYLFYFNEELPGAHSAIYDVIASIKLNARIENKKNRVHETESMIKKIKKEYSL